MRYFLVVVVVTGVVASVSLGGDWESHLHSDRVSSIWADESSVYWGSTGGVVVYDRSTGATSKIVKGIGELKDIRIAAVVMDSDGNLWIGTEDDGVSVLLSDGSWEFHGTEYLDLPNDQVTDMATWENRTAVATEGGATLFETGKTPVMFVGDDWGRSDCNTVLGVALNASRMLIGTECGLFAYTFSGRRSWTGRRCTVWTTTRSRFSGR
jgi:ligand-binding sensor domain-containing protein